MFEQINAWHHLIGRGYDHNGITSLVSALMRSPDWLVDFFSHLIAADLETDSQQQQQQPWQVAHFLTVYSFSRFYI